MKGIQPTPLSTDTTSRSGCRSNIPERITFVTTRAFPMKSSVPPMASLVFSACESQGYWPKKVIAVWLAPMWKWTGSRSSEHTSQNGSQDRLARSGAPRSWGSDVMFTPRAPEAGDAPRLADACRRRPTPA